MPRRVNNVLLVTSLYDRYTFIEDGRLSEMLLSEYLELNLRFTPSLQRISTAQEALERLRSESFDLVISMPRVGEMNVREFGAAVHEMAPDLPVVLLASNAREVSSLQQMEGLAGIERVFVWLGDVRLFLAIIKHIEDRQNAWHDARIAGVKSIILIEDSVQFYSSYLPMLYTEMVKQTQALMAKAVNPMQRMVRMRARPKILLATSYEEGAALYERYRNDLLGIILDASFPRDGKLDKRAGHDFVRMARERTPDVPILMQSGSDNHDVACEAGVQFLDKHSSSLLSDLRDFMQSFLGFGEFVFKLQDGTMVSRANDLRDLEWAIQAAPPECLLHHASLHDLSTWLMARTEFALAEAFSAALSAEPKDAEKIRGRLLAILSEHRERSKAGIVAEFSMGTFEGGSGFVRIGAGSLGGKGRGLAFINSLLSTYDIKDRFEGVHIVVPPTAVLATGVFDQFMEASGLLSFAMKETDDEKITQAFLDAELPREVIENLWTFLDWVRYPLAVRSSSLLEDASYQPFAGIYETYMIPNNNEDIEARLAELCSAIKRVYASTYHSDAKAYIESTPNRLEEEKMAVVIQQVVGRRHGDCLYPDIAGVARSLNYYPMPGMKPEDGVASVALGLGKTVVDGGRCVRFCPAQPRKPMQSFSPEDYLENAQRSFLALDLSSTPHKLEADLVSFGLDVAAAHGTLSNVGSVFSPDDDAVYDGLSHPGVPLVTMARVLAGRSFPLAQVLSFLLKAGAAACSCPIEIEFAVNLNEDSDEQSDFGFLQIRPLVLGSSDQDVQIEEIPRQNALCIAHKVLGNGFIRDIRDLIYVRPDTFDRSKTALIAQQIGDLNATLKRAKRPFFLVGPGRWGSADPWLGIPVKWAQISGVRCLVETDMEEIHVDPSEGSHFFQNIMSFGIGYLTVDFKSPADVLDFSWLASQKAVAETAFVRHICCEEPFEGAIVGKRNFGAILKPGCRF
jgi:hypothetical protein